jgi:hypothetical protein
VPTLLLPGPGVPLDTWAVIACDQHTSEPAYWDETRRLVGEQPSTLDLVLPEAHLGAGDRDAAIASIHRSMARYLDEVLEPQPPGFMLVEREIGRASPRRGLVVGLDLARFDYRDGAKELIRSTEGTDPKRLPARTAVRRGAALETPHILVLIDDPGCTVVEPLRDAPLELAYDFELMQGGGRVRGWRVTDSSLIDSVASAIAGLRRGEPPLAYAMGDGNHSFAAARAVWEELQEQQGVQDHPARHALVELVNVHDAGLEFAPIHRLVEGLASETIFTALEERTGCRRRTFSDREAWQQASETPFGGHRIAYLSAEAHGLIDIEQPAFRLPTATLHDVLDPLLATKANARVDYIHGDETLAALAAKPDSTGFLLPAMDKHDLFRTVIEEGATPRKTFSLGEAHEKRYYLECRRIA